MKVEELKKRAESIGFDLHESITEERLQKMDDGIMLGHAIDKKDSQRAGFDWKWDKDHFAVPGKFGEPGEEVVCPPTTDKDLGLVVLPSYQVVEHVDGVGSSFDGDYQSDPRPMTWTILRKQS